MTYHIYESLKRAKNHISFHTPGHKGEGLKRLFAGSAYDLTELSSTDDLGSPTGPVAAAQRDIAELVGAKRAYITTDGSTSGIYAMLYAARRAGGKIIVPRNSHKSVWNACRLFGLEPVIVQGGEAEGILTPPEPEKLAALFAADEDICGIIAVSPDYYGVVAPLEKYAEIVRAYGRLLLVDGAHGAHLAFGEDRALYAGNYADMWVDGAHKSLPALTQGSAVFSNNLMFEGYLSEGMSLFRTTSPSFPLMASVEYGYKYTANNLGYIQKVKAAVQTLKKSLPALKFYPSGDWTKLCLDCAPLSIDSRLLAQRLEKRRIYPEFADGRYAVFYLSPCTQPSDLNALRSALASAVRSKKLRSTYVKRAAYPAPARTYSYLYALAQPCEYVPVSASVGRMSACNAGLMPPCIPVVAAGEIITEDAARLLQSAPHTFGLDGGNIKVVKRV